MTIAIEERLRSLGDVLDVDDVGVDDVLARLDDPPSGSSRPAAALRVAVVLVVALTALAVVIPSSRHALADWFGFDGARIERRPAVSVPSEPDPVDGRGGGTVVDVGGNEILVSSFTGTLDNPALVKIATEENRVIPVTVVGAFGLWIDGAPHEVSFFDANGELLFEGFAGNTLLWQDGPLIRRLEGFDDLADAIEYAESLGRPRVRPVEPVDGG